MIKQDPAANNNASNNTPFNNNPANNNPNNPVNNNPNNPVNNNPNNPVNNNPNNPVNNNPNNPVNNNPVCSPTCTEVDEGDRRCAGGAIERCGEDAQGCLMWQVQETCGANQACEDEGGDVTCECVNGEVCPELDATCLDATTREVCNIDGDGCAVFGGDPCDSGAVCDMGNGACVQTCEDDSACPDGIVGEGRCLNGTCYAPCGADGTCAEGEVCADGVCVATCDDMPLCRTQETCVEPAGGESAYCEPSCEPHADHDPNGAGTSQQEALDLADGQVIEVRTCREDGVWLRVPGRFAGDRLELGFLSGANLDVLEVEVIESSVVTSGSLRPDGPGETLFWDVGSDGDVFLHLIFEDVPTDAFWIDVELGLEIASVCDGAEPLILNEPRELTTATPLTLSRTICPMQEVWVQTAVQDRAQLTLSSVAQGDLQVALGQEPLLPLWASRIAQEERTLQVRRLEAGPLYVRFTNPTPSPIQVESSLTLATPDACADAYSNNQSPVDAPWISRGTTSAVVCEGRPDLFKIAPPPGTDGVSLNVRLSASNLRLEWSTNPDEASGWTAIDNPTISPGYNLAALRVPGGPWTTQPLYLRVTRQGGTNPNIGYNLFLVSNLMPPMDEMDDLNLATAEQPLQLDRQVRGHLSHIKPTDHFLLTPDNVEFASFRVQTPDAALSRLRVEVDDANGRPLVRRVVGGVEERVSIPTTAQGPYQVRLSAARQESMEIALLTHYTLTPDVGIACNREETLLPAGGRSRAWAELGQTHTPRGAEIPTLCPQEQSLMELEVQGLNEVTTLLHKLDAAPRRLVWSLEGPGCGVSDRTVWVGSTSQAADVLLGARCGSGEDALLTAGTYTLRLGNPDGEAVFLNASALERRDLNNPNGPCPEVFDGPDGIFNDRLFSAEVAPAGQLLIPGSPVSGSLGFCGEYGDSGDLYAFYVPTSGTAIPIHLAWIGEPEGTPVEWILSDEAGVYVADSRDDVSEPDDGPSRYVMLDAGWYTLRVELPGGYVSTDTTASAWYSVSVGEVVAADPPACSGADMLTEYERDAFLMQFNNPGMLLYSPVIPPAGSLPVSGTACAFELDMAHVKVPPNHDVRAILTPTDEASAPLMGLDAYQMRSPASLDNPVGFDFTQEYDDATGDYYVPAVVYWHESTPMSQPGHLLRAYTVGASNASYTLNIADLDCADRDGTIPTEGASPSDSNTPGNNAPDTARVISAPARSVAGTLCSTGRDEVDWLVYTHPAASLMVSVAAKLRFEHLPGVRRLTFQASTEPAINFPSLADCPGEPCVAGGMCCIQTPVTLVPGQTYLFEVRRSAAGQGESAGVHYSMTLE